jgi:protein tyrosine/serine phosphatase
MTRFPYLIALLALGQGLTPAQKKALVERLKDKDLPNFAQVAPGIYRGAAPTAAGLKRLKQQGVALIVDLRIESKGQAEEAKAAQALGLQRMRIPMGKEAPTKAQVEQFLKILDGAKGKPVFVHCQHGADRTGAMLGIYRAVRQGWTFAKIYEEMRSFGFKPYLLELKSAVQTRAPK